jgi:hypothetical protein
MKSKQLGFVLITLIIIGIIGISFRLIFTGGSEYVLKGLMPITQDVIDSIEIESIDKKITLIKIEDDYWEVGKYAVFAPKMMDFWTHVNDINEAQLIAREEKHHALLGVDDINSTKLRLFFGSSIQETFHIGKWEQNVRLCYIRKGSASSVYSIPCSRNEVFSSNIDSWRNPIVVATPFTDIESFDFIYPDSTKNFGLSTDEYGNWYVSKNNMSQSANLTVVDNILQIVQLLPAIGFEDESISDNLDFDAPDSSLRINTLTSSQSPTTRLKFIKKDDQSYYVKISSQSTVFIIQAEIAEFLMLDIETVAISN